MSSKKTTVLKFGGSVLGSEEDLPRVVHEIYRHWRKGERVLAVVSAFGGTTDSLITRAKAYGEDPNPEAFATLLLTGEAAAASLLGLAVTRSGIPCKLLTPEQVGIRTNGDPLDGEPIDANVERLRSELEHSVVIVSGFAGIGDGGGLTLLGRGGTDYTALFLAQKLDAKCRLVKDVAGLYDADPSDVLLDPKRYAEANYSTAIRVGGVLVQEKAVRFARDNGLSFEIAALGARSGTFVGEIGDRFADESDSAAPLRVALLGCGTVGGGVYHLLKALPKFFEITGVVNLDAEKAVNSGIDRRLLRDDAAELIENDCDVVVELVGGIEPARKWIELALRSGRHVVTANKALMAASGLYFQQLAEGANVSLNYSASVGGVLPALEAASLAAVKGTPRSIKGIINGTCNFICGLLSQGISFEDAVERAQNAGYAEADPTLDLNGTDAAQKLILLARAAFGIDLSLDEVEISGIEKLTEKQISEAAKKGSVIRLVAECGPSNGGFRAVVRPVEVAPDHPFAQTVGADNCLLIESADGDISVNKGRGAGRYATAESVMADLFDVRSWIITAPAAVRGDLVYLGAVL